MTTTTRWHLVAACGGDCCTPLRRRRVVCSRLSRARLTYVHPSSADWLSPHAGNDPNSTARSAVFIRHRVCCSPPSEGCYHVRVVVRLYTNTSSTARADQLIPRRRASHFSHRVRDDAAVKLRTSPLLLLVAAAAAAAARLTAVNGASARDSTHLCSLDYRA